MNKNDISAFALEFGKGFAYVLFGHRLGRRIERKISAKTNTLLMCALGRALKLKTERNKVNQMEKDVALGSVGKLQLSFSGGKAMVAGSVELPGGLSMSLSVVDDAGALIDQLEAIVAKALPATAAIDPAIFAVIKEAVLAIG